MKNLYFLLVLAVAVLISSIFFDEICVDGHNDTDQNTGQRHNFLASVKTVKFYSYMDARNPTEGSEIIIGNVESLEKAGLVPDKKIRILIHGFGQDVNSLLEPCRVLVPAYLEKGIVNSICVDWSELAARNEPLVNALLYAKVLQINAPKAGNRIAEFIIFLMNNKIITTTSLLHLIGTSIGAHVAGRAGARVTKLTGKKVGRITGLDPAGPFLDSVFPNPRLRKSDAAFVDTLHTDTQLFGSTKSFGHVDYFSNGGKSQSQPDCLLPAIIGLGLTSYVCGHSVAALQYQRTVKGEVFIGCKCMKGRFELFKPTCAKPANLSCILPAQFGEYGSRTARGNYYVDIPDRISKLTRHEIQ